MSATRKNNSDENQPPSGVEIFENAQKLTIKSLDGLLKTFFSELNTISFQHLSPHESNRLIAQIQRKQDIIHSSFLFQIKNKFADFKASRQSSPHQSNLSGDQILGLVGTNQYTELEELKSIVVRYQQKYSGYYVSIADLMAKSIARPKVDESDFPVHVEHLCLSLQSAIDTLNLVIAQKVALYKVFADLVIESIEPLYISLQQCFIKLQPVANVEPMSVEKPVKAEPQSPSVANQSIAMSNIPVLMGVFQNFKNSSSDIGDAYADILPNLKKAFSNKSISDFDSLIEQLSVIFGTIFADEDLPDQIKQQLARLQIYIFMSEIQQSGFALKSSHPARRLIDTIIRNEVDIHQELQAGRSGCDFLRTEIDKISNTPFVETDHYSLLCRHYLEYISAGSDTDNPSHADSSIEEVKIEQVETAQTSDNISNSNSSESKDTEAAAENTVVDIVLETEKPVADSKKADNIYAVVQSILNDITLPIRLQGRSLILFDEVWFPLLLKVAGKKGFKSRAWQRILTIAKTQAWVLTPKATEKEFSKLKSTLAHMEKSLTQGMQSLSIPAEQQASLLEFLEHEQADVISQSKTLIEESSVGKVKTAEKLESAPVKPGPETSTTPKSRQLADTIDEFSTLMETGRFDKTDNMLEALESDITVIPEQEKPSVDASSIHKSDWVEIKQGSKTLLAKLTWKDSSSNHYIFVDREGHRVCEISRDELNKELEEGRISLISSTPISKYKRSSFSVIQTIS